MTKNYITNTNGENVLHSTDHPQSDYTAFDELILVKDNNDAHTGIATIRIANTRETGHGHKATGGLNVRKSNIPALIAALSDFQ